MKGLKLQSVDVLALALKDAKVRYEKEYGFDPERKWRADIAVVGKKVIIEIFVFYFKYKRVRISI